MADEFVSVSEAGFERYGFPIVSVDTLVQNGFNTGGRMITVSGQPLLIIKPTTLLFPSLYEESFWQGIEEKVEGGLLVACKTMLISPLVIDQIKDHANVRRSWRQKLMAQADQSNLALVENNPLRSNQLTHVIGLTMVQNLPRQFDSPARQLRYDMTADRSVFRNKPGYNDFSIDEKINIIGRTRELSYGILNHFGIR